MRAYGARMRTHSKSGLKRCDPWCTPQQRLAHCTKRDPLSGCLIWQRATNAFGYGCLRIRRQNYLAHRWAWMIKYGPIPKHVDVCHRCDERRCVNTDHLFLDTHAANMADMTAKWRSRRKLGVVRFRTRGGLPPDASPAEIAPIRILYNDEFEIVGDVVVRPLVSNLPANQATAEPTGPRRPPSTASRKAPRTAAASVRAPTSPRRSSSARRRSRTG